MQNMVLCNSQLKFQKKKILLFYFQTHHEALFEVLISTSQNQENLKLETRQFNSLASTRYCGNKLANLLTN